MSCFCILHQYDYVCNYIFYTNIKFILRWTHNICRPRIVISSYIGILRRNSNQSFTSFYDECHLSQYSSFTCLIHILRVYILPPTRKPIGPMGFRATFKSGSSSSSAVNQLLLPFINLLFSSCLLMTCPKGANVVVPISRGASTPSFLSSTLHTYLC